MAELFKDLYSEHFFEIFTDTLEIVLVDFNKKKFLSAIYNSDWGNMEFKQRMHHISDVLKSYLSDNYKESIDQLYAIISTLKSKGADKEIKYAELVFVFIPDFIEQNGMDEFECSLEAFEKITQFTSCEFAIRPFIIKYEGKMLERILTWTTHENIHVRRLASEGSRSRLPWGMAIQTLKNNPAPVLPILEALKADPSEYVRKSVANNLNDISKDNPQVVIDIANRWIGTSKETDWIVKHACRTLLKDGHQAILQLFGFGSIQNIDINNFQLIDDRIKIGQHLEFHFDIDNKSIKNEKIRLEYGIYYLKKNGALSRKVYKISEKYYAAQSLTNITRRQSFRLISTRKFYAGPHQISLIINGIEVDVRDFELEQQNM